MHCINKNKAEIIAIHQTVFRSIDASSFDAYSHCEKHGVFGRLRFVWICSVALSASFKEQASGLGQLAQNDWRSLTQKRCPFHKDARPSGSNQHTAK